MELGGSERGVGSAIREVGRPEPVVSSRPSQQTLYFIQSVTSNHCRVLRVERDDPTYVCMGESAYCEKK